VVVWWLKNNHVLGCRQIGVGQGKEREPEVRLEADQQAEGKDQPAAPTLPEAS
jgi:hypothetical protein